MHPWPGVCLHGRYYAATGIGLGDVHENGEQVGVRAAYNATTMQWHPETT